MSRIKRIGIVIGLVLALSCLMTSVVLADIIGVGTFNVVESNGNSYITYPLITNVNNSALVTGGKISASALDTRVTSSDIPVPHMITTGKTLWVGDVDPSTTTQFRYTSGNVDLSAFAIIVGTGGYITTADAVALELGSHWKIWISGYMYMSGSQDMLIKTGAIEVTYTDTTIDITIHSTPDMTLSATASPGEHDILIFSDEGTNTVYLYIDNMVVPADSTALTGAMDDTADSWVITPVPYWTMFKMQRLP